MSRVAITTTADRARRLAETAVAHGLRPVILPCIEVVTAPRDLMEKARAAASRADWIVVTSPRAITSVWPQGDMPDVAVAAVGRHTEAAVGDAGGRVSLVGEGGAGPLIRDLAHKISGGSAVFVHGSGTDRSLIETLEEAGAQVMAVPVYETHSVAPGLDQVEAAMFGSPSAVTGWCRSRSLDGLVVAAIGRTTERALVERGRQADVIPPRPSFEALIPILADYLRRSLV